jgi:hypothetical protein
MLRLIFISKDGEKITTYIINLVWVFFGFYFMTTVFLVIRKLLKNRKLGKEKNSIPNAIRGGTEVAISPEELSYCLEEEGVYEIRSSNLKTAIRKVLGNRNLRENLTVDRIVVLLAAVTLSEIGSQLSLVSIDFVMDQIKASSCRCCWNERSWRSSNVRSWEVNASSATISRHYTCRCFVFRGATFSTNKTVSLQPVCFFST